MGSYLAPDASSSIKRFVRDMDKRPCRPALMEVGDLNSEISKPEGNKSKAVIMSALAE